MSYYIYSSEALPNPELMGKPSYTPDQEYIRWAGITLPVVPKGEWMKLPDSFKTLRRQDWRDRQGTEIEVHISKFKGVVNSKFAERGVIFLDHEPTAQEKKNLESLSMELHLAFRKKAVEWYEDQVREKQVTGQGRTRPTAYEDECFTVLGMKKPYSAEALQAQRDPGQVAAKQIAAAITDSQKELVTMIQDAMTAPRHQPAK